LKKAFGIFAYIFIFSGQASAASCNDQAVIDAFLERYVCTADGPAFSCSALAGIGSYRELKLLSREEIRNRVIKAQWSSSNKFLKSRGDGNAVAAKFADNMEKVLVDAALGAQTLIRSISASVVDYDQAAKRFNCQANIVFDKKGLNAVILLVTWAAMEDDAKLNENLEATLRANNEVGLKKLTDLANGTALGAMANYKTAVAFTVQPKQLNVSTSDFVVNFKPTDVLDP
jgi:hypothetical protein